MLSGANAGGGARGCGAPPEKDNMTKIKKKQGKKSRNQEHLPNITTMQFTNGSKVSFRRATPHPNFVEVRTSPKLILDMRP